MDLWLAFVAAAAGAGDGNGGAASAGQAKAAAERRCQRDAALCQLALADPDNALGERLFGAGPMRQLLAAALRLPEALTPEQ